MNLDVIHRKEIVDRKIYYGGFKVGEDRALFKEELKDLEIVYTQLIQTAEAEMEVTLPSFISYMRKFIELHDDISHMKIRLDDLRYKRGDDKCNDEEDCDDDE